jgi:ribosomal-protein-alanine N-acetyltransferase
MAMDDAAALAAAYRRNRDHLAPWDPRRDEAFFSEAGQLADLRLKLEGARLGLQDPWLLVCGAEIVGRVNLSNIVRGVFQNASVGYWVDARHTGRGLAVAMVEFALARADETGLHRVEAGTLAHNAASQGVLRRCGFEQYGVAERYLFIAGEWQDHNLYQRILHDRPVGEPAAGAAASGGGAGTT